MRLTIGLLVMLACLTQAACSMPKFAFPRVHKVTIQQGNVITQRMIDQLKPGMTRDQVAFVMGEPIFLNPFAEDRWDYIYSLEIPGVYKERKRLTVHFQNDLMTHFSGDFAPTEIIQPELPPELLEDA